MIHSGRFFAKQPKEFVLFILGMKVHNPWKVYKWFTLYAMVPRIFKELEPKETRGYLGGIYKLNWREPLIIQYWSSLQDLHAFSLNPDRTHFKIWDRFNEVVGKSEDIGVWHESYVISEKKHESMYINMPFTGLGQFTALKEIDQYSLNYKNRF